jgi:hypothetical protein
MCGKPSGNKRRFVGDQTTSCSLRGGSHLLKMILADYKIQTTTSKSPDGGIAAFDVAAANPQYFLSVTAFPGYMWEPSPVGENDEYM